MGTFKIGKAKSLENRTRIFNVKLPFEWELIHSVKTKNYTATEKLIHKMFSHKRIKGTEWFNLDQLDLKMIMQNYFPKEIKKFLI